MNTSSDIMGMIFTEAAEQMTGLIKKPADPEFKPIHYNLELIELPDGSFVWVDD